LENFVSAGGFTQRRLPDSFIPSYIYSLIQSPYHSIIPSLNSPKQVLQQWVNAFNRYDANALADLYHEDAINHQVNTDPLVGRAAIQAMFEQEFAQAEMVCIVENMFEDGDWAIMEWKDPKGLRGCGFFQIIEGKIRFQRGYWDRLSFLRQQGLPIPTH
jgi:limonene-1,2-epoxide hydrolase